MVACDDCYLKDCLDKKQKKKRQGDIPNELVVTGDNYSSSLCGTLIAIASMVTKDDCMQRITYL